MMIIGGVTQGLKNKDIAMEVGTTEQVVKNYLRKIYDKLGVADRLELALYSMHRRLLDGYTPPSARDIPMPIPCQLLSRTKLRRRLVWRPGRTDHRRNSSSPDFANPSSLDEVAA